MSEMNRSAIVVLAAVVVIVMAVVAFLAWAAPDETIGRLEDFVRFLGDHNDNAGKLILTLGALTVIVLAVLVIVVELAPEEQPAELQVEQAGATTVVSVQGLRQRLEEVLLSLPAVTGAKVNVASRNKGIATALDLTVLPQTNVALVSREAIGVVTQTLQEEMGLPLAEAPRLRIAFGAAPEAEKAAMPAPPAAEADPQSQTPPEAGPPEAGASQPDPEGRADDENP